MAQIARAMRLAKAMAATLSGFVAIMYGWLPRGKRLVIFGNWSGAAMYSASDLR